jgi:glycosyltransferase involved in cell wall biosynthesis
MSADAARLGLSDRFELLGFVEHRDLPATYRSADLLAAPSQYEGGLGMVYLEAMACGLPVIAAAAGGAREAIVPWETGVLLERGDVDDLCAAVRALLDDAGLRQRLGAAGRARVVSRFAIGRYAERVAAAYERAVEHRRASVVTW